MALKNLSVDLQALLSSSLRINSHKRAVEELVYNSLDAKASSIAVRINIDENIIQVIDNGCGITEKDFDVLGQKYMTSKCVDLNNLKSAPNTYGFQGQSLANIISISQKVNITSRQKNSVDTWCKIFYKGKHRELAKGKTRPSVGTTVEITGLLYNRHIQSKAVQSLNEINDIKTFLKQLSLVHTNISISFRDDSKHEIIFKAHKNRDVYQTIKLLFDIDRSDIQELTVEKHEYKVTGFFRKRVTETCQHHWIYLNGKYISNSQLHQIVNDNLTKSLKILTKRSIKTKTTEDEELGLRRQNIPFYIILISCPYYDYDVIDISKQTTLEFKNWQDITKLLDKLIKFYNGDKNFNKQLELQESLHDNVKVDETRAQVKKIVEKLLKSNSKKLGVSQMQNGVKGKLVKRKIKKKPIEISLSKVILPKSDSAVIKHLSKKDLSKKPPLSSNTSEINEIITKEVTNQSEIPFIKNNKRVLKKPRKTKLMKKKSYLSKKTIFEEGNVRNILPNASNEDEIKNFNPNAYVPSSYIRKKGCVSVKNKYSDIHDEERIHTTRCENIKRRKVLGNEMMQYSSPVNYYRNVSIRKKVEEILIYDYIPHPLNPTPEESGKRSENKINKRSFISSHDLVNTILSSQVNKDFPLSCCKIPNTPNYTFKAWNFNSEPSFQCTDQASSNLFVSKLTFESHNYRKNVIVPKKDPIPKHTNKPNQFITTHSRDNFMTYRNNHNPKSVINNKFKTKFRNAFNIKKVESKNTSQNINLKRSNIIKDKYLQKLSFVIDPFESNNKVNIQEHKELNNTSNFLIDIRDLSNGHHLKSNQIIKFNKYMNKSFPMKLANTTTDVHVTPDFTLEFDNSLQATYIIHKHSNNKEYYNQPTVVTEESLRNNYLNIVFLSKSLSNQNNTSLNESLFNPLMICETILSVVSDSENQHNCNIDNNQLNGLLLKYKNNEGNNTEICRDTRKPPDCDQIELLNLQNSLPEISHHFNGTNNDLAKTVNGITLRETPSVNSEMIKSSFGVTENKEAIADSNQYNNLLIEDKINEEVNVYDIKNRLNFMPKGMSQIFKNCNTKNVCDYNLYEEYFENGLYHNFVNDVQMNSEIFKPRLQSVTEVTYRNIDKVNAKLHKENASLIFDGQSLKEAQILGQIDDKFIASIVKAKSNCSEYLVLFDQHAVHERIRLEKNLSDYLQENKWRSVKLDNILLKLTEDEILYLHNFKEKFVQFGLECNILSTTEVSITAIPEAILGKNPRQAAKVITAVKNLISEEINMFRDRKVCISLYAKSIMELVFSEACRYAIKFGDKLSKNDCVDLLQSLSECKTPFQCAHGRPVMAVIMDKKYDAAPEYKVNFSKINLFLRK